MPDKDSAGITSAGYDIPRPRLNNILAAALQKRLAVLQAGAGFGKTRAAASYLPGTDYRAVWHTFTLLDNNPVRFWESLTASFALHRPTLGEKMAALGFPDTSQAFSTFLADLTAELYTDERTVVFVFDDLYLIDSAEVTGFLSDLIAARLENSCILLLARQWPVPGIEAAVPMQLVDADELRFTDDEATALFQVAGVETTPQEAAGINHYVSGWPIALSMVALSARREGALPAEAFLSGTKPQLFALFEREIFSQYTPREQSLLVPLSALESFPRGLVQAVSGEKGRELGQLMRGNIFIHYDATAQRLYFHPLYQEFLREKLPAVDAAEMAKTYRRAAAWCRENGHLYDAVDYYRRAGNPEDVWDTLLRFEANRHTQAEAEFFIRQIEWLPQGFRNAHPMAGILQAVMLTNNLRFGESLAALDAVQTELEQLPASPLLGECYAARGIITIGMEQNGYDIWFKKAAELLPQGSSRWDNRLLLVDLGPGLHLQSAKASELKKSVASAARGVPYIVQALHGAGQGLDKLCECEALFLTGETKTAAEPAYQALYAAQAMAQYDIVGNALFMLMRIYTVLGEYQHIQDTLEHVHRYQRDEAAASLGIWDIIFGWFYAELGESARVAGWVRNAVQHGYAPVSIERALLVRMRCLIADGAYHEALALLEQFDVLAQSKSAVIAQLYGQIGRAVAHHYLGQHGAAGAALKAAYSLAKGNHLIMPFIEYGNRTRSLLERARTTGVAGVPATWLDDVHAKASTFAKRHAYLAGRYHQSRRNELSNFGLSHREVELLAGLSQGLTREEISAGMHLSLNTVKSMTKQVFAKLGAINSADAVRIALVNKII
ncbi:LuxR C-terminal-related transcriptional regulator [Clostridia bacterium OttesenSCG-928-O13]|nr:LuxR C-terminal-related transcriptional regulator [Clostridia bacterium OttesenSCG-928-O13]